MDFDVLVLGGGTAGCVLAARLSEEPSRSVCLVEAGPDYGPFADGGWPEEILDGRALALSHAWRRVDEEDRSQLRARILGGCSAHNACVALRGLPADYDEWGEGWNHSVIEPYLERVEHELRVRRFRDEELSPWQRAFVLAGRAAGLRGGPHPVNASGSIRWTSAFAYLDPARSRENLTLLPETLVDRILLRDGRAQGAETSTGTIEGKTTIVTAGTYGSPAILLRSGIGPGLETDIPVGENLRDHVGVGYEWAVDERLSRETEAFEQAYPLFAAQVTLTDEPADLFLFPWNEPAENGGYEFTGAVFAMKPFSSGSVRLACADSAGPPSVNHGFLSDERDVATVRRGLELVRDLGAVKPLRELVGEQLRPAADEDLDSYVRAEARGFFHPVGTCAIGSVVDGRGRVHGVPDLVVADASIIPTVPRANTNLSVAAVAERIAELL